MSSMRYTEEFKVEGVRQIVDRGYNAAELASKAPAVMKRHLPAYIDEYQRRGWTMF